MKYIGSLSYHMMSLTLSLPFSVVWLHCLNDSPQVYVVHTAHRLKGKDEKERDSQPLISLIILLKGFLIRRTRATCILLH